jgi:wyosine [tRNA(Phe)-imidazoG37] synthetase (radical SAM superfamily)
MEIERHAFYDPEEIVQDVRDKVEKAQDVGEQIDYLTFVPDGEPTLDINLGREIALLKPLGVKIAVITNGSLVWREDVREALSKADWVSLKVDAVRESIWRRVDRPRRALQLAPILDGALKFAQAYQEELTTETMLVRGVNDREDLVHEVADFVARLQPAVAYLSVPIRPPAEKWVHSPGEEIINRDYQILRGKVRRAEYLIGYEGNAFAFTGHVESDLLSITAVHPMREDAMDDFLTRAGSDWLAVHELIAQQRLTEITYGGHRFYMRRLGSRQGQSV